MFSNKIESIEKNLFPLFEKNSPKIPIVVLSKDPDYDFNRLFSNHKLIKAAGGIVQNKEGKLLFIKRFGKWDIPKGKLDENEDPEKGAIREIEEECGILNPTIDKFICNTYHTYLDTYKGKNKLTLKKTYWYSLHYDGDEELIPQTEEGITKVKWFKPSKIDKVQSNTYESILDVIDVFLHPTKEKAIFNP
ncbi:MAG TPA: NUDIX domain-containing protein [Taishania sp.]|nr:NUDIX domain-containing protein [Taishania sp.]